MRRRVRAVDERMLGPERRAGERRLQFAPEAIAFGMLCLFSISIYLVFQHGFEVGVVRRTIIGAVKVMLAIAAVSWVAYMVGGKSARVGNTAFVALFAIWAVGFGGLIATDPSMRRPAMAEAGEESEVEESDQTTGLGEGKAPAAPDPLRVWAEHAAAQDERYREALDDSGVVRFREMTTRDELVAAWSSIPRLRRLTVELSDERLDGAAKLERVMASRARAGTLSDEEYTALGAAYDRATAMAGFYALEGEALGELLVALGVLGDHYGTWSVDEDGRVVFDDPSSVMVAGRYADARLRMAQVARAQGELRSRMPSVLVDEDVEDAGEADAPESDSGDGGAGDVAGDGRGDEAASDSRPGAPTSP